MLRCYILCSNKPSKYRYNLAKTTTIHRFQAVSLPLSATARA
jgi:hypothetical protein